MKLNAEEVCTKIYKEEKLQVVINFEAEDDVLWMEDRDFLFELFTLQSMES